MCDACRMQFMDDEKATTRVGILDPLRVAKTNFTTSMDRSWPKYKKMSKKKFDALKKKTINDAKREVAVYIGLAISNFMKDGKQVVKIPYHFG